MDFWAEKLGRKEREDDNGGVNVRTFEGKYTTSGTVQGAANGVKAIPLPVRGSLYPGTSVGLELRIIEKRQVGSSSNWIATLTYLPPTTGDWSTSGAAFADLPRSWGIAGELIQFADSGEYYYVNVGADNDPILGEVPAFKKLATGQFTMQEIVSDIGAARTRAKAAINRKNDATFETALAGDMLYLGFESEEFTNDDGDKRWRLRHQFLERDIPGKTGNGWEYVLRDDTAEWAFIQITPGANTPLPVYLNGTFLSIFGVS